jgi:hypothetical protein
MTDYLARHRLLVTEADTTSSSCQIMTHYSVLQGPVRLWRTDRRELLVPTSPEARIVAEPLTWHGREYVPFVNDDGAALTAGMPLVYAGELAWKLYSWTKLRPLD